jgi:glycosyltransferase involved in cell wall biosynthesis
VVLDDCLVGTDSEYENALRLITLGADWSWFNHTGMFASPTFENLLRTIGTRLVPDPHHPPIEGEQRRVLHVLTQAYPTGGHTRLAWRWMALDESSEHSVLLTSQYDLDVPSRLTSACDGRLYSLGNLSQVEKIQSVASHLEDYDLIVLHIHPFDAVAVAACAGVANRSRTLLVNHADHVFWLGLSAADQIVNLRPASEWIARDRRTGSTDQFVRLALPLDQPNVSPEVGRELRSSLGIAEDEPVVATIAEPYKFASSDGLDFRDLVGRLFARIPSAHLIAVGPSQDSHGWGGLQREFPTRVHLLGTTPEYASTLAAADVYLDSFPFSSITSMLEAALHGVPVVTMAEATRGPLNFDDYRLTPDTITSPAEWLEQVERWCRDLTQAAAAGSEMHQAVSSVHGKEAWIEQVDALYTSPWVRPDVPVGSVSTRLRWYDDAIHELHRAGGLTRNFEELAAISGLRFGTSPDGMRIGA